MAMKIEREYTKEEILEIYVNTIYFGDWILRDKAGQ